MMKSNTHNNNEGNRNRAALIWIMISVVTLSFTVFIIDWGETNRSPFFFAVFHNAFAILTFLIIIILFRPKLFSAKILKTVILPPKNSIRMNLLLVPCIISGIATFPLLSIATKYIDIIPVAIIYGMSPLFLVLLSSRLFRKEKRFKQLTLWFFILFIFGLIGFGFVAIGQSGESSSTLKISGVTLWGAMVALLSAFCNALSPAFSIRHAAMAHQKIKEAGENIGEIYCTMISLCIQRSIAGIVLLIITFSLGEQLTMRVLWAGLITGVFVVTLGGIAVRQANLLANNLGINSIATPFFAVIWLLLFREPKFMNFDFLIIGATAIITANFLLNFEAEIRLGYKALILALWGCGTFVYFRQGVMFYDYFNLIEVAVVIFILVLSFRTDRLVRRTTNEENNTIELQQKISTFVTNKKMQKKTLDTLLQISAYKTLKGLQNSYNELKNSLTTAKSQIKDKKIFSEILGKIDMLVHSKQQGINFGELTALFILTFITTGGILFLFPSEAKGWAGFFVEMFSFLMASTVLFLFFNILDLQKDRNHPILKNAWLHT